MGIDHQVLKTVAPAMTALLGVGFIVTVNADFAIAQPYPLPTQRSLPLNGELVPLDAQPSQPMPSLQPSNVEPSSTPAFSFTNTLEYGDCLEVILKLYGNSGTLTEREQQSSCFEKIRVAYGNNGLSKLDALQLISAADFYATTLLSRDLYPLRGQRVRIASLFGFIYTVDVNDSHIRNLAVQAPTSVECQTSSNCI